jgi:hypothetical protein
VIKKEEHQRAIKKEEQPGVTTRSTKSVQGRGAPRMSIRSIRSKQGKRTTRSEHKEHY